MIVERENNDEIFSKKIRAGKRTYFFDVKATKGKEYYLAMTESRRIAKGEDFVFEKSKIFVYKEDLDKILEALQETIHHIKTELMPEVNFSEFNKQLPPLDKSDDSFSDFSLKWE
jgi:lipopolysaccharide export LptBFGC system permease protein LptF